MREFVGGFWRLCGRQFDDGDGDGGFGDGDFGNSAAILAVCAYF